MRKKLRFVSVLVVFLFAVVCSACSEEEITKPRDTEKNINSENGYISPGKDQSGRYKAEIGENILVDAAVDAPDIKEASVIQVTKAKFNEDEIVSAFFNENKPKRNMLTEQDIQYSLGDASLYITQGSEFKYNSTFSDYILNIINPETNSYMTKITSQDLNFMSKEKAIEKANQILKKLNIKPYSSPKIYSLDFASLEKEQKRLIVEDKGFKDFIEMGKIKLKSAWTQEDDCYYIDYRVEMRGLPCDELMHASKNLGVPPLPGSKVTMIVSKEGIKFCSISSIYTEKSSVGSPLPIISIEQALESLNKKYNNVILSDKLTVSGISLAYSSVFKDRTGETLNIELIPTWIFSLQQKSIDKKNNQPIIRPVIVRINALNGKEML